MFTHIENREIILQALIKELFGPAPAGEELDCSMQVTFSSFNKARGPWRQKESGEEILQRDIPTKRYGCGVLFPYATQTEERVDDAGEAGIGLLAQSGDDDKEPDTEDLSSIERLERKTASLEEKFMDVTNDPGGHDFDLSIANKYNPSSIGVSFLVDFHSESKLVVNATGGRYNHRCLDHS